MKIIDLLNKIANGEEVPKKIKYDGQEYKTTKILLEDNNYYFNYINEDMECIFPINTNHLNDEVEILEEEKKIPEKISLEIDKFEDSYYDTALIKVASKIDELIDYLDYLKSKGE